MIIITTINNSTFLFKCPDERSDKILIALNEREQMEQDYYMKTLSSDPKKQSEIRHAYIHLLRQHLMGTEEKSYLAAAVAVGLAEFCNGYNVPRFAKSL